MSKYQATVDVPVIVAFKKRDNTSGKWSRSICWWTKSEHYHVEMAVGDVWITSSESEGTVIRKLRPLNGEWEYVDLGTIRMNLNSYTELNVWLRMQDGKGYDWKGIFLSQVFPFRLHSSKKWFCSELCTYILQLLLINSDILEEEPHKVSPGKLYKLLH